MNASKTCRLIFDEPASGVWNMAVDEALLEDAADGAPATLRLYRWSEPTLSLGYFQAYGERASHAPSRGLPVVRRSSGGGALVHDHEVTYSLALPPRHPAGRDAVALTCLVHRVLIDALRESGAADGLSTCAEAIPPGDDGEPFLCFQRRSPGDLVWTDKLGETHKLCGSAQRRRRGALLQHGGVLLARSVGAPELPGLADVGLPAGGATEVAESWSQKILAALDLDTEPADLPPACRREAERIAAERFANPTWTERR